MSTYPSLYKLGRKRELYSTVLGSEMESPGLQAPEMKLHSFFSLPVTHTPKHHMYAAALASTQISPMAHPQRGLLEPGEVEYALFIYIYWSKGGNNMIVTSRNSAPVSSARCMYTGLSAAAFTTSLQEMFDWLADSTQTELTSPYHES